MAWVPLLLQLVLFIDSFGDLVDWDPHVFVALHWCVQVEVFNIESAESCVWCGDDAVEQNLGCGDVGCFGGDFAWVVDLVTAYCVSDAPWVFFVRAVCHYQP